MNRRGFMGLLLGFAAAEAVDSVIPLNRVWSFPSNIVLPQTKTISLEYYRDHTFIMGSDAYIQEAIRQLSYRAAMSADIITRNYLDALPQ